MNDVAAKYRTLAFIRELNRTWPGEWPGAASTESLLVTS